MIWLTGDGGTVPWCTPCWRKASRLPSTVVMIFATSSTDHDFDELWEEVQLIVAEPQLARFFRPEHYVRAYNEFACVSRQGELRRMDRVVEFDDEIWILDYKTGDSIDAENLEAAARPYRNQLMEYCTALGELMPGKPVKSALIFSGGLFYPM